MLLFVYGNWHKPLPNEPLIMRGWESIFILASGGSTPEELAPEELHCSIILRYKRLNFSDLATDEMVEAASRLNLSKAVELAAEKLMAAPEDVVELDMLPAQVAAAVALSLHKVTLAKAVEGFTLSSKPVRLEPLEVLKALYSGLELRLMPGPEGWGLLKRTVRIGFEQLKPEDAAAILEGNEPKRAELINLLKAEPTERPNREANC